MGDELELIELYDPYEPYIVTMLVCEEVIERCESMLLMVVDDVVEEKIFR